MSNSKRRAARLPAVIARDYQRGPGHYLAVPYQRRGSVVRFVIRFDDFFCNPARTRKGRNLRVKPARAAMSPDRAGVLPENLVQAGRGCVRIAVSSKSDNHKSIIYHMRLTFKGST